MALDINDANKNGIDPLDPALAGIQGNIIRGHDREHANFIFLNFKGSTAAEKTKAKGVIKAFAMRHITTALNQHKTQQARAEAIKEGREFTELPFAHVAFSKSGYDFLGLTSPSANQLSAFNKGMGGTDGDWKSLNDTGESAQDKWDKGLQEESHAMIILAHNDETMLTLEMAKIKALFSEVIDNDALHVEHGFVLRNDKKDEHGKGQVIEHFGNPDGISQPLFTKPEIAAQTRQKWDPSAPLNLALRPDPHAKDGDESGFGSYFVFRKLEQNVKKYHAELTKLKDEAGKDAEGEVNISESLGNAYAIGRHEKDGVPVVTHETPDPSAAMSNDFNYNDDPDGNKCPLHAHIRKTNPRGSGGRGESLDQEREHRIVRRGISYGVDISEVPHPEKGSGLLFMCYQRDLDNQFRFMQRMWANADNFPFKQDANGQTIPVGVDPTIGQNSGTTKQQWPRKWGNAAAGKAKFDLREVVTTKGGGYFFSPCMSMLNNLADDADMPAEQPATPAIPVPGAGT